MELVENGKTAPNFTYVDINGDSISLHNLKGNVIALDFWAIWCKPCIAQMPDFEKLKSKYKGKDIRFISISSGKDIDQWRNFVLKNEWKDIQLFTGSPFGEPQIYYTLDYMPTAALKGTDINPLLPNIPRYVIIDKDLKIHNNKAPKPGSEEMDGIIQSLLEK
ncbi:MAG: TlpA disulfide reductase family protein [Chitinophagales bacterium]